MLSLSFRYQSWDSNQKSIKLPDLPTKNYVSSLIFLSSFFGASSICIPAICIAVLEEPNSVDTKSADKKHEGAIWASRAPPSLHHILFSESTERFVEDHGDPIQSQMEKSWAKQNKTPYLCFPPQCGEENTGRGKQNQRNLRPKPTKSRPEQDSF